MLDVRSLPHRYSIPGWDNRILCVRAGCSDNRLSVGEVMVSGAVRNSVRGKQTTIRKFTRGWSVR